MGSVDEILVQFGPTTVRLADIAKYQLLDLKLNMIGGRSGPGIQTIKFPMKALVEDSWSSFTDRLIFINKSNSSPG